MKDGVKRMQRIGKVPVLSRMRNKEWSGSAVTTIGDQANFCITCSSLCFSCKKAFRPSEDTASPRREILRPIHCSVWSVGSC